MAVAKIKTRVLHRRQHTAGHRSYLPPPKRRAKGLPLLLQGELSDIEVPAAEQVRAPREVLHVAVVDLLRLDRDRLVSMRLQRRCPLVERRRIVRFQRLHPAYAEPGTASTRIDHRH